MKIRYVSDLHLEICPYFLPYEAGEEDESWDILVLAGDIAAAEKLSFPMEKFFEDVSRRFRNVIYVPGNHEYYNGDIVYSLDKLRDQLKRFYNVVVLQNEVEWIDGIAFIGATLWTDMFNSDNVAMANVKQQLNDFWVIKNKKHRDLDPKDVVEIHKEHKAFIFEQIGKARDEGADKVVVISHHAPSFLSIHPKWAGSPINAAFSSDLMEDIKETQPDYWFHGHMHDNFSYEIGNTKVLCNPRGYARIINSDDFKAMVDKVMEKVPFHLDPYTFHNIFHQENVKFDPWASVEI